VLEFLEVVSVPACAGPTSGLLCFQPSRSEEAGQVRGTPSLTLQPWRVPSISPLRLLRSLQRPRWAASDYGGTNEELHSHYRRTASPAKARASRDFSQGIRGCERRNARTASQTGSGQDRRERPTLPATTSYPVGRPSRIGPFSPQTRHKPRKGDSDNGGFLRVSAGQELWQE
jgi:hypothetical protein